MRKRRWFHVFGRVLPHCASSYSRTLLMESQVGSLEGADEELVGAAAAPAKGSTGVAIGAAPGAPPSRSR